MAARQFSRFTLTSLVFGIAMTASMALADVVNWRSSLDVAKVEAAQSGRLVLLHFWTPSCGPCRKLDSEVFSQPQIGQMLETHFVPVKINADLSPALASAYNITRVPTDIVLTSQGNVVAPLSCPMNPADYGTQLVNLVQHYRQSVAANSTPRQPPMQSAYTGLKVGQYRNTGAASTASQVAGLNSQQQPVTTPAAPQAGENRYANAAPPVQGQATPQATNNRYANVAPAQQTPTQPQATVNRYATAPAASAPSVATPAIPTQQVQAKSQTPAVVNNQHAAAKAPTAVAKAPTPSSLQLPDGSLPLGFEGYCPVTLKQMHKWVMGNTQFGATHRGRTYLFTSDKHRQQFLANPDFFSPVFSGMDAVKLLEDNQAVEGSRKYGFEYRNAFYLFSSKASMDRFASQPDHYAAGVRQAMTRMDTSAGGTIRR